MKAAAVFAIATIVQLAAAAESNPLRKRASSQKQQNSIQPHAAPPLQRRRIQSTKKRLLQTSSANSTAPCSFCPSGVPDPTLVLPVEDATTCLQAQEYAATLLDSDAECPTVKLAEDLCCPPTIYDVGAANPDFSTLVSLVDAAGLSDVLKGEGTFTLFGM